MIELLRTTLFLEEGFKIYMRSLRAASKRLLQIIPTKVMWLPYLQIKSQRVQNAAAREFR